MHCQNENKKLHTIIELQNLQLEFKDKRYSDQTNQMEILFAQIEELRNEKLLDKKSHNQDAKNEVDNSKSTEELICLNALLNDKDEEIEKVQRKLESQESEIWQHQQQMKELQ